MLYPVRYSNRDEPDSERLIEIDFWHELIGFSCWNAIGDQDADVRYVASITVGRHEYLEIAFHSIQSRRLLNICRPDRHTSLKYVCMYSIIEVE